MDPSASGSAGRNRQAGAVAFLIGLIMVALHLASRSSDFAGTPSTSVNSSETQAETLAPLPQEPGSASWQTPKPSAAKSSAPPRPTPPPATSPPIEIPPPMGDGVARKEAFWRVTKEVDADTAAQIKQTHVSVCSPIGNKYMTALATGATVVNPAHTVRMTRPGWFRLFVAAEVAGQRACRGGDVIEASMESADSKVNLDVLVDHGDGLYEAHVYLRRSGVYTVCTDAVVSYAANTDTATAKVRDARFTPDMIGEFPLNRIDTTGHEVQGKPRFCNSAGSWAKARCMNLTVEMPAAAVAQLEATIAAQRTASGVGCSHPDAYRAGEWRRVERCDDVICSGDLRSMDVSDSGGWVWASDRCVVKIFDKASAWEEAAGGRWMVGWGDSTLKQPLANFVEYQLGVPIFKVDMEHLEQIASVKKRPGFFSYRQYHVVRPPPPALSGATTNGPFALSYGWGGCPNAGAPPNCPRHMGMRNRDTIARYMGLSLHPGDGAAPPTVPRGPMGKLLPDVIVMNHFVWRAPLLNETDFVATMHDTVQWLHTALRARVAAAADPAVTMPLLVWITGVRRVHGETSRAYRCSTEDTNTLERHLTWLIEHELTTKYPVGKWDRAAWLEKPAVLVMSRHELTMPFHTGDEYGHFGVHYGATKGMCLTGISHKQAYELSRCLRKTFVDGMLIQWWLNALRTLNQTAPSSRVQDAGGR